MISVIQTGPVYLDIYLTHIYAINAKKIKIQYIIVEITLLEG